MGRDVTFDFATGGGSDPEILIGTVTMTPTHNHQIGNREVLPFPSNPVELVNGKGTLKDVAVSPAGPEPAWGYKVTVTNGVDTGHNQQTFTRLVGVPEGVGAIPFKNLTIFTDIIPPGVTGDDMQRWADDTRENADRAEAAAERAEAAYGAEVLVPVPNAYAAVSTADYWLLRNTDTNALLVAGIEYGIKLTPNASFTLATLQMGPSPTGSAMVDTLATDLTFTAGVPVTIKYTPSVNGLMYLRLLASASKLSSVEVFTVERKDMLVDLRNDVASLEDSLAGTLVLTVVPNQEVLNRDNDYKTIRNVDTTSLLRAGVEYAFELTPSASFTQPTLQMGPSPTGSQMVDTLATNVAFVAGVKQTFYYTPSVDGLMFFRIVGNANNISSVKISTVAREGGLDGMRTDIENLKTSGAGLDQFYMAQKVNKNLYDDRAFRNNPDGNSLALDIELTPGVSKTATVTGGKGKLVRVGLHYESARYTPSGEEIFFDKACRKDFSDVRFFDHTGRMLKATLGEPVNLDLLEDSNLDRVVKIANDGTLIASNSGIYLSTDNGASFTLIPGTSNVTTNASVVYDRTSMYPVFVDASKNIFAYAGGILYKLLAADNYVTKTPVLTFSWQRGDGSTVYPDIQNHAMDVDKLGNLFMGSYAPEYHTDIFRSTDGGNTWSLNWSDYDGSHQHVHHIHADKYSNKLYVAVDDGGTTFNGPYILVTSNGGASWSDITELGHDVRGRDYYPTYFGQGYKLGGGESYYNGGGTVLRSEDDVRFTIPVAGIAGVRSYADFGDDSVILAGTQHCNGNSENNILMSTDKGKSWVSIYRKLQPVESNSGKGFRDNHDAVMIAGDTEKCAVMGKDSGNLKTLRVYRGGDHYYREAWVLLEDATTGPVTITAETGYLGAYPYKTLNSEAEHAGLVYHVPLNEGMGKTVTDSLGNLVTIKGAEYEWDHRVEPVRYGDIGGKNVPAPFTPSAGLRLKQGTTLNFGKIPALAFSKSFTLTFWINPANLLMDPAEYAATPKTLGILNAGNIAVFHRYIRFGYSKREVTQQNFNSMGYRMMRGSINGYGWCDQYFFVAMVFNADGSVKVFLNGAASTVAPETSGTITTANLSTGDFVIGSDLLQSAGYLSNIKVYNRIIPDAEILDMYRGL